MEIIESKVLFDVATQKLVGIDVCRILLPTITAFTKPQHNRDMQIVEGLPREHILWLRNDKPVKHPGGGK
jgi:hypothetical protein